MIKKGPGSVSTAEVCDARMLSRITGAGTKKICLHMLKHMER